ncbi:uncharacterized protein F4807DRAFT_412012 [Annulohypoxylon truncatum]|uniref:uncharacterized protein n=1 Tax=Annulohypoxylon truncatum TaxID=327061 RepID=UPI0020086553|nr:uncharacterized protein F4807DRAFT_412012 [Annulohypoxylon truncatum]KAI1212899.1 hypothetical protein F4807DRAFT_412012 [Annulohypoxylon truncatum]
MSSLTFSHESFHDKMFSAFNKRGRKPKSRAAGSAGVLNNESQTDNPSTSQASLPPIDLSRPGLIEFKVPEASGDAVDVVFVHGLNGNSAKTWENQETGFWWPGQLGEDLPHARILLFNYDTFFYSSSGSNLVRIPDIARNLSYALNDNRFENAVAEGTRPLVMIGHSLGGLIIQKALIECMEGSSRGLKDILNSTISIILFSTPNAGSFANDQTRARLIQLIGKSVGYKVPERILEALKIHSLELYELSTSFQKLQIWNTPMDAPPFMQSYYETRTLAGLGIQVVDETSSKVGVRGEVALSVQADHNQMVKFRDKHDSTYQSVKTAVRRAMAFSMPGNTISTHTRQRPLHCSTGLHHQSSRVPLSENGYLTAFGKQSAHQTDDKESLLASSKPQGGQIDHIDRPAPRQERKFMGQQEHLKNIDEKFSYLFQPGPKEPHSIGLLGLGGVGKTQLALKYFRDATSRQDNPFTTAFWIDSSSEGALQTAISRIWKLIRPQKHDSTRMETTENHETMLLQVMSTLEKWTRPYLIIFDNANSQGVIDYIPRIGPAAVIITTRLVGAADALDSPIWVRGLAMDTATLLLLRLLINDSTQEGNFGEKIKEAEAIVKRLAALPLAIHAAASYMKIHHLTDQLWRFLPEYEQKKVLMLQKSSHSWGSSEDNQNVFTTWGLSLQALGTDAEDRARKTHFLSVCSFLSPHRISSIHFEQHYRRQSLENCAWCSVHHGWMKIFLNDKQEFDRTRFREVITEFKALSLVESCAPDASGLVIFSLHSLVRDWAMVRHGCCDGQTHFAEALVCLAATLNACNFVDGHAQPAYLFYDPCQPVDRASPQIREALLSMPDELSAHVSSCLTSLEEYEWDRGNLEALGLTRLEEKSWFSRAFNSLFLYAHTSGSCGPQIDNLAIKFNEEALLELFETTQYREDCQLFILLHQQNRPHDIEDQMERARGRWQRDRSNTKFTFGELFATYLHQLWLIRTEEFDLFRKGLPALIKQAEGFMKEKLIDISKQAPCGIAWRWIKWWRRRTSHFVNDLTYMDLGLYLVFEIMRHLASLFRQASADIGKLIAPIMEWLRDYWLPESFHIHLRTLRDGKNAMPLFSDSLARLGYLQRDLGRFDDLFNTLKFFDALTASRDWFFTFSFTTEVFLRLEKDLHRERRNWRDAAVYTEKLIQLLEKALPDDRLLRISNIELAGYCLQTNPMNKTRADEILSSIAAEATAHGKSLSQEYVDIKEDIAEKYYNAGLYEEAYKRTSQLLQEIPANNNLADATVRIVNANTATALLEMLRRNNDLPGNRTLEKHLSSLTVSLFVWWKSIPPDVEFLSVLVKLYVSRGLWSNARRILIEYLRIVGNRQCTAKDCDYRPKGPHPELRHFLANLTEREMVMDLLSLMERQILVENTSRLFKEFENEDEFVLCCFNVMLNDISRRRYRSAEIYWDWIQTWLATHHLPVSVSLIQFMTSGMALKFMLGKWQDAYELFLKDIDNYLSEECSEDDVLFYRLCLSLLPNLPRPAAASDRSITHVEIVLLSWWLIPYILDDDYWIDDESSWRWPTARDILTSVYDQASGCSICYPILANSSLFLYRISDDGQEARYWIRQSIPKLKELQSLGREQIPDDHHSIYQLVDSELDYALRVESNINELEGERTQDQDPASSGRGTMALQQDYRRDPNTFWERVIYSLGPFLGKWKPARLELLGVVLLTSGVMGGCAFRIFLSRGK